MSATFNSLNVFGPSCKESQAHKGSKERYVHNFQLTATRKLKKREIAKARRGKPAQHESATLHLFIERYGQGELARGRHTRQVSATFTNSTERSTGASPSNPDPCHLNQVIRIHSSSNPKQAKLIIITQRHKR
ncbi:uncharacterized protein DS421_11g337770 [Arachis hypogaea]|nr:uncharacterized protein DS421_11g337770 [Arachis hypogaea]